MKFEGNYPKCCAEFVLGVGAGWPHSVFGLITAELLKDSLDLDETCREYFLLSLRLPCECQNLGLYLYNCCNRGVLVVFHRLLFDK